MFISWLKNRFFLKKQKVKCITITEKVIEHSRARVMSDRFAIITNQFMEIMLTVSDEVLGKGVITASSFVFHEEDDGSIYMVRSGVEQALYVPKPLPRELPLKESELNYPDLKQYQRLWVDFYEHILFCQMVYDEINNVRHGRWPNCYLLREQPYLKIGQHSHLSKWVDRCLTPDATVSDLVNLVNKLKGTSTSKLYEKLQKYTIHSPDADMSLMLSASAQYDFVNTTVKEPQPSGPVKLWRVRDET